MTNPCPAHIGCAGDCNKCNYIGGVKVKCTNKGCTEYQPDKVNDCGLFNGNVTTCPDYIAQLQAELKLYKRALQMMAEEIHDLIYDNGLYRLRYDACFIKGVGCKKGDGHCPECLVKHFKSQAEEE